MHIDSKNPTKIVKSTKKSFGITQYEKELERNAAVISEERILQQDTTIDADGNIIDGDGNRGHGNDPDGVDPDNPGKKKF